MKDIVISSLSKRFGEQQVLQEFSAVFPAGETVCIMGPSGCGKTTLLNILLGFESPDAGNIDGVPARISVVFQEDRLCEEFSALANIHLVTGKTVPDGEILDCLRELGLSEDPGKVVGAYSGGMKRRVAIARALLAESELLIMDEPFKGLDEGTREMVAASIRRRTRGKTVIMVTHDPEEARMMQASVMEMRKLV